MNKVECVLGFAVIALILSLVALAVDRVASDCVPDGTGVVIQKIYEPATHTTGVGFIHDGKTNQPVVTSNSTAERWVVLVQKGSDTFSASVNASDWGKMKEGEFVNVLKREGFIFSFGRTIEAIK